MRFPALQGRNFRIYEGGSFFSVNGQWINRVLIGWELTGSAAWVGILSFFLFAPTVISSPLYGVLLDRGRLKLVALINYMVVTLSALVLYFLYAGDVLDIWSLSAVALVIGFAGSADRAVRVTIMPRMVERAALPNAVTIHAANFNVARLIGPAIGGTLIETIGTDTTMLVNVIVFLPYLAAVLLIRLVEKGRPKSERKHFLVEMIDGARYTATHPAIREAMLLTCVSSLTVRGVGEIVPAIADGVYQRGAEGLGQMLSVGGGALIVALTVSLAFGRQLG